MAGRFSVEAVFKAVDRVTAPVSRMQNRVSKFTRSMGRGFDKLNRNVGRFASGVKRGAIAITAALAISGVAMANVIGIGADFEQTLVNAAVKFPGEIRKGTEAFNVLGDAAKNVGLTTEFTANQAASALNFLAMAGFNAEGAVAALPGVVDLATAAQVNLATATDIASDTLGAFSLMTKDTAALGLNLARVNDVIAKTTTSANTTVESLFETIREGGPVATAAGASIETFSALAGELANSGIKGSKAGTTLKNTFLSLAAPTAGASKILRKLGVSTQDANGDMLDIVDILGQLDKSLAGLGTAERAGVLEGIFGKIPIAGVNILLASGADRLREYRTELEGASGAAAKMAAVMRDTLRGRINSLTSALEGVKIGLFGETSGPLADAIDEMTQSVRDFDPTKLSEFIAKIINNSEAIFTFIKRLAIGLAVFFAFAAVLKTIALVLTVVNLVMAANPIVLIVLGIMALIAAIALVIVYFKDLFSAFKNSSDGMSMMVAGIAILMGPIGWLIGAAALIFKHWEPIKAFFKDLWADVVDIFNVDINKVMGLVDKVKNAAASIVNTISSIGGGVGEFFGFGPDETGAGNAGTGPQIVSPQARTARTIEESRTSSSAEVTIRDATGRAEVTSGSMGQGLSLQSSGAF